MAAAPAAKDRCSSSENWSRGEAFRDIDLSAAAGWDRVALVAVLRGRGTVTLARRAGAVSGRIEIAGGSSSGAASQRLCPGDARAQSLQQFLGRENLLVRLGKPDITSFGLTLKEKPESSRSPLSVRMVWDPGGSGTLRLRFG